MCICIYIYIYIYNAIHLYNVGCYNLSGWAVYKVYGLFPTRTERMMKLRMVLGWIGMCWRVWNCRFRKYINIIYIYIYIRVYIYIHYVVY